MCTLPLELIGYIISKSDVATKVKWMSVSKLMYKEAKRKLEFLPVSTAYHIDNDILRTELYEDGDTHIEKIFKVKISIRFGMTEFLRCVAWYKNKKLHRIDGPACKAWYEDGGKWYESWYKNGKFHRDDGPSIQEWFNGKIFYEAYYKNGVRQDFKYHTKR